MMTVEKWLNLRWSIQKQTAMKFMLLLILQHCIAQTIGSEIFIDIPLGDIGEGKGLYRLDYTPPQGNPGPNAVFTPEEVSQGLKLSGIKPGAKYALVLYYSNGTLEDVPTWVAYISTVPDPPPANVNLSMPEQGVAVVSWKRPNSGHSAFRLRVISLSGSQSGSIARSILTTNLSYEISGLLPGHSYELQLHSVFDNKQSSSYVSRNFTMRPDPPAGFDIFIRNETTLVVLWLPPNTTGTFSYYVASIDPPEAVYSEVEVDGVNPQSYFGQAAFHGLYPGRAYEVTVTTVSVFKQSEGISQVYRTMPPTPGPVALEVSPHTLLVRWEAPKLKGEIHKYLVTLEAQNQSVTQVGTQHPVTTVGTHTAREVNITIDGIPGQTYFVNVSAVAGNSMSWPSSANVTARPLPVTNLTALENAATGMLNITWIPDTRSIQDRYKVVIQPKATDEDEYMEVTNHTSLVRNIPLGNEFTVKVTALSMNAESLPRSIEINT